MSAHARTTVTPIRWVGDADTGAVELLDQRLLPGQEVWHRYDTFDVLSQAITDMVVRGAPAIGVTAAFGVVLAAQARRDGGLEAGFEKALAHLAAARPTAVNLAWALQRMRARVAHVGSDGVAALWAEAEAIRTEDLAANAAMGALGAELFPNNARVLTICNTGSLATAGIGTALGVIRALHDAGKLKEVLACETRPYLQGARLTMWELMRDGIPAKLVTDGMPGHLMSTGQVDAVIAGADRIAANGDSANKIGTYGLAVLAAYHDIPFYIAAPTTTIDPATATGAGIPIEQRSANEVTSLSGVAIAPIGAPALHPAFDVTPASLIRAVITEAGVAMPPNVQSIAALLR
ncbi:MAG: methylthioribose-1-phosphate isomerase [Bradymonadia bacterium]|jgi:methylthioribose-1-phosphate isomerase